MRRALALVCASALSLALLAQAPPGATAAEPDDAETLLRADADGPLRTRHEGGVATYVGAPVGTGIDHPSVGRRTSLADAGRAHLRRYGAALGADRQGTALVERSRSAAAGGAGVLRYQQRVRGVPVLGGEVVVTVGSDRELTSLNANLSTEEAVADVVVDEAAARAIAIARVERSSGGTAVAADQGRWLLDPDAIPLRELSGARTAWRFEVRSGPAVRRLLAVDDRTGALLLDVDLIQGIDRMVCDQNGTTLNAVADPAPCTSGAARSEGSPASSVADVNAAFDNAGLVSEFYEEFGSPAMQDLTALIGVPTGSGKKLASTVRVCIIDEDCPYDNAYWNGVAVFYGAGYAGADDIVGHEMTHGVIERRSGLLYWDQSGAINESLADIIGEIVDHQNPAGGDDPAEFLIGEDLTGPPFRSAANPTAYNHPDRVRSPKWYSGDEDNGGVHFNSGVGNKAFHLLSQGGTFNGQSVTGIDAGDPLLTKSATLWPQVIEMVPAFAEYDDLADVLATSCASLVVAGDFSADDCVQVDKVIQATELRMRPTAEPVRDVDRSCPEGSFRRSLLDSESGDAGSKLAAPFGGWWRVPSQDVPAELHQGHSDGTSWFGLDGEAGEEVVASRPLRASSWIHLPESQPVYLAFRHWHVFEYDVLSDGRRRYWDGGTVELAINGNPAATPLDGSSWVNGPTRNLVNVAPGRKAFGGSSRGWFGSRVDISGFSGQWVKPQFTIVYDDLYGAPGWYLDDILVYTCDPLLAADVAPTLPATMPRIGTPLTVTAPTWNVPDVTTTYQWRRNGVDLVGSTEATYTPVVEDSATSLSVVVTGTFRDQVVPVVVTAPEAVEPLAVLTAPTLPATTPRVGRSLAVTAPTWNLPGTAATYQWRRDGVAIPGRTLPAYTPVAADLGRRLSVVVTGAKGEQTVTVTATSAVVAKGVIVAPSRISVSGTPRVGRRLGAVRGTWSPSGTTFTYRWFRGSKAITGATGSTYLLRKGDRGYRIQVRITATKPGYTTVARTSAAVLVRR